MKVKHSIRLHGINGVCDQITEADGKLATLTDRERETARLIADCKSTKQIAAALGLSIKTIESHRANVFAKLQVHSVAELVRYALRLGCRERLFLRPQPRRYAANGR